MCSACAFHQSASCAGEAKQEMNARAHESTHMGLAQGSASHPKIQDPYTRKEHTRDSSNTQTHSPGTPLLPLPPPPPLDQQNLGPQIHTHQGDGCVDHTCCMELEVAVRGATHLGAGGPAAAAAAHRAGHEAEQQHTQDMRQNARGGAARMWVVWVFPTCPPLPAVTTPPPVSLKNRYIAGGPDTVREAMLRQIRYQGHGNRHTWMLPPSPCPLPPPLLRGWWHPPPLLTPLQCLPAGTRKAVRLPPER